MRKIEKEMLQAICNRENFCKSNTKVLVNAKCVYVKLYETIIYVLRNGLEYFSDGGFNTVTTSSRAWPRTPWRPLKTVRQWLRAQHSFYGRDGDPIQCTGWQFVGYNLLTAVFVLLLCIE